jgi:hypothetical protein
MTPANLGNIIQSSAMDSRFRGNDDLQRDNDVQWGDVYPRRRSSTFDCAEMGQARMNPRPTQDYHR